jgi:ADP-dependent NAD(P)H-hydrate dehydratase
MQTIDQVWIAANPLPPIASGGDKNTRGRVLVIGGAEFVPGALQLTGEAVLRAGAGKLQLATVRAAAMSLAVLMPEAAMIALPADDRGEISATAIEDLKERLTRTDVVIVGPGMSASSQTGDLVASILQTVNRETVVILDAAALTCARHLESLIRRHEGQVIITPHHGEMSYLTGVPRDIVAADPVTAAREVAQTYKMAVLLKADHTVLAAPDQEALLFTGGCIGLATGGSGDVLAGLIGGFAARGAPPRLACAWAAYIHGAAGATLSREIGPLGFLARELLSKIPRLIVEANSP